MYLCSVLEVEPITEMTHRLKLKGDLKEYAVMELVRSVVEFHDLTYESGMVYEEIVRAETPISPTSLDLRLGVKRSVVMQEIERFANLRLIKIEKIGRIRRIRPIYNVPILGDLQANKHDRSYNYKTAKIAYRELALG